MAGDNLKMDYSDMRTELGSLANYVAEFRELTGRMSTSVNTLCDGWNAQASETYREDYTLLADNFARTADIVEELIQSTQNYIDDMSSMDAAYAHNRVSQ